MIRYTRNDDVSRYQSFICYFYLFIFVFVYVASEMTVIISKLG